jgi:hypothetical protein
MTEGNDGYFNKEVVGGEGRGDGDFVDGIPLGGKGHLFCRTLTLRHTA